MNGHRDACDVSKRMALDVQPQVTLQVRNADDAAERHHPDETDDPDQNSGRTSGKTFLGDTGEGGVLRLG